MSSEGLNQNFDHSFSAAIPAQVPAERKPRKRLRSIIKHERRDQQAQFAAARREKYLRAFQQVLECYVEVSSLSPLGASSIDSLARRNGLTYLHVEWLIDIQHCAKSVLSPFLYRKWQSLLSIETQDLSDLQKMTAMSAAGITPDVMHRLTQKLGQSFYARELKPWRYFTTIRRRNRFEKVREQQITFVGEGEAHASSVYRDDDEPALEGGYGFGVIDSQDNQQEEE